VGGWFFMSVCHRHSSPRLFWSLNNNTRPSLKLQRVNKYLEWNWLLIGLIFISLCKINVEVNDWGRARKITRVLTTTNAAETNGLTCLPNQVFWKGFNHRISIPAYAIEQQWWQLGDSKNEMSLMSFIFKMMLVLYQSGLIGGVISNIYWHASKWSSISFSHW
jgi:hypothetical protein